MERVSLEVKESLPEGVADLWGRGSDLVILRTGNLNTVIGDCGELGGGGWGGVVKNQTDLKVSVNIPAPALYLPCSSHPGGVGHRSGAL